MSYGSRMAIQLQFFGNPSFEPADAEWFSGFKPRRKVGVQRLNELLLESRRQTIGSPNHVGLINPDSSGLAFFEDAPEASPLIF